MEIYTNVINTFLEQISSDINEEKEWLWSQVYADLGDMDLSETNAPQLIEKYIEDVIKPGKVGWNHSSFTLIKKIQQEQDDYILNPFEAEEGVVECKKCGSSKVYSVSVQTRASDEPMTTMAQCTVCKTKWSYNG